jgi:hypothetical protein
MNPKIIDTDLKDSNIKLIISKKISTSLLPYSFKQNQLKYQRTQYRKITCSNTVLKKNP